jgi:hypothetical protein
MKYILTIFGVPTSAFWEPGTASKQQLNVSIGGRNPKWVWLSLLWSCPAHSSQKVNATRQIW